MIINKVSSTYTPSHNYILAFLNRVSSIPGCKEAVKSIIFPRSSMTKVIMSPRVRMDNGYEKPNTRL
ncbi:MAG TPA: hypothetical protein PK874_00245 [Desulfobacteraceae bacterium]|nr:hypothetical protein [Desulfobacteraceae bacterium]HPJ66845.1 hypothetical protein [Desulfobacteraceae bacterium]